MATDSGDSSHHLRTLLAQAGCKPDETGAVTSPIHLATTFEREGDLSYRSGFVYGRENNPTRQQYEGVVAAAEGGGAAAAFASGMAAISTIVQAMPKGHIVMPTDLYHGSRAVLLGVFKEWGLPSSTVDLEDAAAVKAALDAAVATGADPVVLFVESPSNPMLKVASIEHNGRLAHDAGALMVVDSTWLSPVLVQPLRLGADLVVHSATKYIGGHSDLTSGIVVGPSSGPGKDVFDKIRKLQQLVGAVASPFDCWLAMRGLRTLSVRMEAQCAAAMAVAQALASHPAVEAVLYPGLPSHAGHAIAEREYGGRFGAMLSVCVRGGQDEAAAVAARLRVFRRATSLGGTESLVEHRRSIEGPLSTTPVNLLRLSVGLEHPTDLVADLTQALDAVS